MRYVKMLGLAAVAALASMAFIGTGSASADWLCHLDVGHENECAVGWRVAKEELIVGLTEQGGKKALLLDGNGNVKMECDSKALGKFKGQEETAAAHDPVLGLIELLTFYNCSGLCEKATGHSAPFWLLGEASTLDAWILSDNEDLNLLPGALLENCGFPGVHCLYRTEAEKALLKIEKDLLIAHKVPLLKSAGIFACPHNGFWDALYLTTLDKAGKHETPIYLSLLP